MSWGHSALALAEWQQPTGMAQMDGTFFD